MFIQISDEFFAIKAFSLNIHLLLRVSINIFFTAMNTELQQNAPFSCLLTTIGEKLEKEQVQSIKHLLKGHINRETLQNLTTGHQLTKILNDRGLVTEKKLAFLRKLLVEAKSLRLVDLLDTYKSYNSTSDKPDIEKKCVRPRLSGKREILLRMIERIENEIKTCEEGQEEFEHQLEQCELQVKSDSAKLVMLEDSIQKSKDDIKEYESQIEIFERKLATVRLFIKKHTVESDKLKRACKTDKANTKLRRELKDEEDECEKNIVREDALLGKYQENLDLIRTSHVEIRHHLTEIIRVEDNIHNCLMQIRAIKHGTRKGKRALVELQEKLQDLTLELEQTKRLKPLTPASRPQSRLSVLLEAKSKDLEKAEECFKLLDYGELSHSEAIVVGFKGKQLFPPHFNLPCSLASHPSGHVYVVDCGNSRIQILNVDGRAGHQPLNVGGKFKPCAIAISCHGDIAVTDSQIIRIFGRNGHPLRPVLPVFGNGDRRPHLTALAFDNQKNIYVANKANHKLQKFTFDGNFISFIGDPRCLCQPVGLIVTTAGDVVVSEHSKHRLKVFLKENTTEPKVIGCKGSGNCRFMCPRGLALDNQNNILVADSENHRIQVVSIGGEFIGDFGTIGWDPGSFHTPHDVAVDADGNVIVADTKNHRLQIFTRRVPNYENATDNIEDVSTLYDCAYKENSDLKSSRT